ncbi:MAG: hypothetical protein J7L38_08095 [Thermoproteales archaeon]|nr:hypothetical protein [Thermoproteales archaeon]
MSARAGNDAIKRMAELLKRGATMLSDVCPICKTPLFRLNTGEVICPQCERRIFLARDDHEVEAIKRGLLLKSTEDVILSKIEEITVALQDERNLEMVIRYLEILKSLLENLEKIRNLTSR